MIQGSFDSLFLSTIHLAGISRALFTQKFTQWCAYSVGNHVEKITPVMFGTKAHIVVNGQSRTVLSRRPEVTPGVANYLGWTVMHQGGGIESSFVSGHAIMRLCIITLVHKTNLTGTLSTNSSIHQGNTQIAKTKLLQTPLSIFTFFNSQLDY